MSDGLKYIPVDKNKLKAELKLVHLTMTKASELIGGGKKYISSTLERQQGLTSYDLLRLKKICNIDPKKFTEE